MFGLDVIRDISDHGITRGARQHQKKPKNQDLRRNPTNPEAYYYRALAYEQVGKHALANKDNAQAKELGYKN